jgi:hypothetical protein
MVSSLMELRDFYIKNVLMLTAEFVNFQLTIIIYIYIIYFYLFKIIVLVILLGFNYILTLKWYK